MRIIHLSDIHLTAHGDIIWDTDTMAHFDRAMERIREIPDVDVIVVTGDLSDDGSPWSYQHISQAFASLGIPTYYCPGNHDDVPAMRAILPSHSLSINQPIHVMGWKFLLLDSTIPDMGRGMLNAESMDFLQRELSSDTLPTVICFHHPSVEPGGWLNRKLLQNREEFNQLILGHPQVRLVLYGHIHYAIQHQVQHTLFSAAPSVGYAFDLNLPKFQIAAGREGFNLMTLTDTSITTSTILIE